MNEKECLDLTMDIAEIVGIIDSEEYIKESELMEFEGSPEDKEMLIYLMQNNPLFAGKSMVTVLTTAIVLGMKLMSEGIPELEKSYNDMMDSMRKKYSPPTN